MSVHLLIDDKTPGYRGEVALLGRTKTLLYEVIEGLCLAQNSLSSFAPASYLFQAHKEVNEGKVTNLVYPDDAIRALKAWRRAEDLLRKDVTAEGWDSHEKRPRHLFNATRSNIYSVSSSPR